MSDTTPTTKKIRMLPKLTPLTEDFWRGGADGELRILRCRGCGYWIHPPAPVCPECWSRDVGPVAASGYGIVHSYTVNHQVWNPTWEHPYVIAVIELGEQRGLRLTTNIVGVAPDAVAIGMAVQVTFERDEDVWLPLFTPVVAQGPAGAVARD